MAPAPDAAKGALYLSQDGLQCLKVGSLEASAEIFGRAERQPHTRQVQRCKGSACWFDVLQCLSERGSRFLKELLTDGRGPPTRESILHFLSPGSEWTCHDYVDF